MSRTRSRKLRGSLGDSWGDENYSSDGGASVHSASSFADGSESEYAQNEDHMATPLPPRITRASSQTPQDNFTTATRPKTSRTVSRPSKTPQNTRIHQPTPPSVEPSFIMPSMSGNTDFNNGSPLRKSQLRTRKPRQSTPRSQSANTETSPHIKNKSTATMQPRHRPTQQEEEDPKLGHYLDLLWRHALWPITRYVLGVFRYAMHHFGTPILGVALTVFLLAAGVHIISNFLQGTVTRTLAPLCMIPGTSYLVPFCANRSPRLPHPEPDFDTLVNVQSAFEDVVQASKEADNLSMHIRVGTNSVSDIRSLVRHSQLPSRHSLDNELENFMQIGKEASDALINYNVKIGSTLSKVIITNDWTLRDLEGLAEQEATTGTISRALSYINPVSVFIAPPKTIDELIFDRYLTHLSQIKPEILDLIDVAVALKNLLRTLEAQLDIIGDMAIHDNVKISRSHDELLSSLWTFLGGNRANRKSNERSLKLLAQVIQYKNLALDHVTATLVKLQEIAAGLEDLSANVATPELLGYRGHTPLRQHIDVISGSLEGFKDLRGERLGRDRESVRRAMERLVGMGVGEGEDRARRELPDSVGKGDMPTVVAREKK
ncbi:hypothetical protein CC80DRAFT_493695 [Byssothecium circinans]|uniref:Uncharacterized protein n=1 Tax=Byssothecium circinans TaxID=147558 RepID=A0A6A5TS49_9PLEO|nr:hypothetical protein CC80DRAFT_493695 [Byssothecium circinans]